MFYLDKYDADDEEDKLAGAEFSVYEWSEESKSYKDTPLTVCEYDKGNSLGEYRATVEATLDNVGKFKIVETKYHRYPYIGSAQNQIVPRPTHRSLLNHRLK